ncbi:cytochrome b [Mesorhizobium sp. M2D.F.Ca.ET.185.01.1.1]|uniref:cytochrome b n=3 Tax=Mesorhizobium TaxID=68287 RepID=UPI000FCBF09E|nr:MULTISPECIES: cytochrome b [unclassified Mesorhizobium]TGP51616.1 cytochrome b [bacterium M00.F.Ca.ET.230.01.1.1]TGP81973.1 cytochrome b [bacterium M00.F.Ca.ET.227.01.1.1]TGP92135.1 cytochrome b [bacterium M00.F.Ca.ET.221.01.1.1]TGP95080.1 cytochrome b [bacterium M00.F.Ca.ET.222.01.1.1]TGT69735.1 cytochrome b [bacterium M00.F.Ca.ET.159.01.1.1]TGT81154.1 cytochrome b [bacterium M00.F.Ca.ET.157.01.1.1]TGU09814.1 cytochrome b [bacterium M00.F.Ca.ET.163.01.1.1]TGU38999.1 cytochrome b [bacter
MQTSITNTPTRYGWAMIVLHWLIGIIFIGQFVLGYVMVRIESQRTSFELIQLHKSFGFLLLGLIILRIAWRLGNAAPALPASVGTLERRTAPLAHFALYAFQVALPLSGWALVSVSTLEIPTMPFNLFVMPNLPLTESDASESFWTSAHWYLAYAGIALVALHIAAALRHHFLLRDAVLTRIITPSSSGE